MASDPLSTLGKADEAANVQRDRRALTEDELQALLYVAVQRPLAEYGRETVRKPPSEVRRKRDTWTKTPLTLETIGGAAERTLQRLNRKPLFIGRLKRLGRERELIYRTLVLTGLRKGELASLRWAYVSLDGPHAWLKAHAQHSKNRKTESLPIRADLAEGLRWWRNEKAVTDPTAHVFRVPQNLVGILDRDLAAAGIPKVDAEGRTVDVHALRHTTATHLAKAGVPILTAQEIMCHSKIDLTMRVYTDPRLLDTAAAGDALRDLSRTTTAPKRQRATGTYDAADDFLPISLPTSLPTPAASIPSSAASVCTQGVTGGRQPVDLTPEKTGTSGNFFAPNCIALHR